MLVILDRMVHGPHVPHTTGSFTTVARLMFSRPWHCPGHLPGPLHQPDFFLAEHSLQLFPWQPAVGQFWLHLSLTSSSKRISTIPVTVQLTMRNADVESDFDKRIWTNDFMPSAHTSTVLYAFSVSCCTVSSVPLPLLLMILGHNWPRLQQTGKF